MFEVNLILRIITPCENNPGELLVFLDEDGNIPTIKLLKQQSVEEVINKKLESFFYTNDLYTVKSTKQISYMETSGNKLNIYYNFMTTSTSSKLGSFVIFNEKSIEIFRMINNRSI